MPELYEQYWCVICDIPSVPHMNNKKYFNTPSSSFNSETIKLKVNKF